MSINLLLSFFSANIFFSANFSAKDIFSTYSIHYSVHVNIFCAVLLQSLVVTYAILPVLLVSKLVTLSTTPAEASRFSPGYRC